MLQQEMQGPTPEARHATPPTQVHALPSQKKNQFCHINRPIAAVLHRIHYSIQCATAATRTLSHLHPLCAAHEACPPKKKYTRTVNYYSIPCK